MDEFMLWFGGDTWTFIDALVTILTLFKFSFPNTLADTAKIKINIPFFIITSLKFQ